MNKHGFTLIELLIVIAIIGILAFMLVGGGGGFSIGDGDRVGIVTKLSHKGIYWKTWEGQMIIGGQGTVTTNVWSFSVPDVNILPEVREALEFQKEVRLSYHQKLFPAPWKGSTTYYITGVTPVKK